MRRAYNKLLLLASFCNPCTNPNVDPSAYFNPSRAEGEDESVGMEPGLKEKYIKNHDASFLLQGEVMCEVQHQARPASHGWSTWTFQGLSYMPETESQMRCVFLSSGQYN